MNKSSLRTRAHHTCVSTSWSFNYVSTKISVSLKWHKDLEHNRLPLTQKLIVSQRRQQFITKALLWNCFKVPKADNPSHLVSHASTPQHTDLDWPSYSVILCSNLSGIPSELHGQQQPALIKQSGNSWMYPTTNSSTLNTKITTPLALPIPT